MKKFLLPVLFSGILTAGFIACETTQVQNTSAPAEGELAEVSIHPLNAAVDAGENLDADVMV